MSRPSCKKHGYKIVPVNPSITEGLGEKAYASLKDIPFPVDIVDCFRRPDAMPDIAREAIDIGAKVLWMQKGIECDEAADLCDRAGLKVVSDRCMLEQYTELFLK